MKKETFYCDMCKEEIKEARDVVKLREGSNKDVVKVIDSLEVTPRGRRIYVDGLILRANVTVYIGNRIPREELHFHESCLKDTVLGRLQEVLL